MSMSATEGHYANHFRVGYNALEFVLEFAQWYPEGGQPRSHTRIVTLPAYAKALAETLGESLERYQRAYGPIPASSGQDRGAGPAAIEQPAPDSEQGRLAMPDRPDDTPPHGSAYDSSWQRDPPRQQPHKHPGGHHHPTPSGEYGPDERGEGAESWQRPEGGRPKNGKPSDELDSLKQKLEHRQTELTTLAKQRDTLKTDIEGLEAAVTELTQIVTAYEQAAKNLEKEKRELDIYVETKTPMLEVAVGEKKETIERIIYDADCEIQEAGDRVEALERDANEADGAAEAARAQEAEEKAAYTALKDSYKQIEQKLKGLRQLRDTIEKDYDDKNKVAGMYFLMKELGAELETIVILSKSELERELYAAWNRLKRAKNQLRDAIARQDAAQEELARARKVFETLTTNRRRTILERIEQYCGDQAS